MNQRVIRILCVDDHSLLIEGLQARCEQLELTVGSLVKLLAFHQVVPEAELRTLVNALEPEEAG